MSSDKIPHVVIVDINMLAHQQRPEGDYLPVATDSETFNFHIECMSEQECKDKMKELLGLAKQAFQPYIVIQKEIKTDE